MTEASMESDVIAENIQEHRFPMRAALIFALDLVPTLVLVAYTLYNVHTNANGADSDIFIYAGYAAQFWHGVPPLHAFPLEYPPLTVLVFSLALFPTADAYLNFELWMAVLFLVGWGLFYRLSGRGAAWRYALPVLALQFVTLSRFDLVVGLICVGALWAAQRRRWTLAYVLLALGTAVKIFPAFLLPLVVLAQWRFSEGRERGVRARPIVANLAMWGVLVVALLFGPYLLDPTAAGTVLSYQTGRPVEIESYLGVVAWLGSYLGIPAPTVFSNASFNFGGTLAAALAPLSTPLLGLGVLAVYALAWRWRLPLAQGFLLCLGVILLTDKVFSAQYMLWILPIAAEAGTDFPLWLIAAFLTLLEYPTLFGLYFRDDTTRWIFMVGVTARNLVVLVAIVRIVLRAGRLFETTELRAASAPRRSDLPEASAEGVSFPEPASQ